MDWVNWHCVAFPVPHTSQTSSKRSGFSRLLVVVCPERKKGDSPFDLSFENYAGWTSSSHLRDVGRCPPRPATAIRPRSGV